jgi:hypothetical protein
MLRVVLLLMGVFWAAAGCAADSAADLVPAPYRLPAAVGEIASPSLVEASGMAASRRRTGCFWMINDGGNDPVIYAVGPAGEDLGAVPLAGATNYDWEDIASFQRNGRPYLLIADTGDNRAIRKTAVLYLVREPEIPGRPGISKHRATPVQSIRFRFPDGAMDCEALAVDPEGKIALMLTKRTRPPELYSLDLAQTEGVATARRRMAVTTIPAPSQAELMADPIYGRFRSQPTALDISSDGSRAAVLTYGRAYLFERVPGETWEKVFARKPKVLPPFSLRQAEALCFGIDGRSVFISTEKRPAPLLRLDAMDDMRPW